MTFLYAFTALLSAFLVFFIQPVVAKIALPTLGGIPAVWNGCMLFFQAVLLAGYLYAHVVTGKCPRRLQPIIHILLLITAVAIFPLSFTTATTINPVHSPLEWLLSTLLFTVGLPYFVISATSPLLQKWFAFTDHKDAENPYFLYAAGNIGSMGSLLLYPFIIEPIFSLENQIRLWENGIIALTGLFIGVVFVFYKRSLPGAKPAIHNQESSSHPTWPNRIRWLLLSFVPSSLLYGVTTYVTTDIASVPLLWIIPLGLYLITFIMVFSTPPKGINFGEKSYLPILVLLLLLIALQAQSFTLTLVLHIAGFFIIALFLHGLLARSKPSAAHLTEFFLWMSLGGVLGGIFNTLIAPFIFDSIVEYPLILFIAGLVAVPSLRGFLGDCRRYLKPFSWIIIAFLLPVLFVLHGIKYPEIITQNIFFHGTKIWAAIMVYIGYRFLKDSPAVFLCAVGAICLGVYQSQIAYQTQNLLFQERSIFGVNKVLYQPNGNQRQFIHGTTLHGLQSLDANQLLAPKSYYSGLEEIFALSQENRPIAAIGLGTGAIACYGKSGQNMDFYEIDPLVKTITSDPKFFTYLTDCPPKIDVILGDGRQQLSHQPDGKYGTIIMDAFSSDSIPTHLITREAVQLYRQKLANGGIIAFHISNRHINLQPVLAAITRDLHLTARVRENMVPVGSSKEEDPLVVPSVWVVIAADETVLKPLENSKNKWVSLQGGNEKHFLWTDDFSNLFFTLKFIQKFVGQSKN